VPLRRQRVLEQGSLGCKSVSLAVKVRGAWAARFALKRHGLAAAWSDRGWPADGCGSLFL